MALCRFLCGCFTSYIVFNTAGIVIVLAMGIVMIMLIYIYRERERVSERERERGREGERGREKEKKTFFSLTLLCLGCIILTYCADANVDLHHSRCFSC